MSTSVVRRGAGAPAPAAGPGHAGGGCPVRPPRTDYDAGMVDLPLRTRVGPWLLLLLVTGLVAVVYRGRLTSPLAPTAPPPADADALLAWLVERAPPPDVSARAEGAWPGLAGNSPLARWARHRIDLDGAPPAVLRGLAVHATPPAGLRRLVAETGQDAELIAILLDPGVVPGIVAGCPALGPDLGPTLCVAAERRRARAQVEAAVAGLFTDTDEQALAWAIELAIGLGPGGAALVQRAPLSHDRARAAALIVQAWTLPPDEAEAVLVARAKPGDPLAAVAALELARLGRGGPTLEALQGAVGRPADAALVELARAVAAGRPPPGSRPGRLLGAGL